MYHEFDIPFEWGNGSNNFVTYHGDIYPGNIIFCPNYKEGFFIIPNININTLKGLKPEEQTPERYRKLGWEIKDRRVIPFNPIPSTQNFGTKDNVQTPSRDGRTVWKKFFVFGAGASAHCCFGEDQAKFQKSKLRPPIGPHIFNSRFSKIIANYPGVEDTLPFFEAKGFDIEASLQEEWDEIKSTLNSKITSRHINIQFYLSELCKQISLNTLQKHKRGNLYGLFTTTLQKYLAKKENQYEQIGIASFNYDTILDDFIARDFGINLSDINTYVDWNKNKALFFKPHGSWNWGWSFVENKIPAMEQIEIAKHLYENDVLPANIYYNLLGSIPDMICSSSWALEQIPEAQNVGKFTLNKNRIKSFGNNGFNYFPALLMPYRDKDEFVMPYLHMLSMQESLRSIEDLFLIGWKGNEDNFNHYIKTYATNLKRIVIVNPNTEDVKASLAKVLDLGKYKFEYINSFEEFACRRMQEFL